EADDCVSLANEVRRFGKLGHHHRHVAHLDRAEMQVSEFHPVDADQTIEIERCSRMANSGQTIRDPAVDDTGGRSGIEDEFQAFQRSNPTFDLDLETILQMEGYCLRLGSVRLRKILLCPNVTRKKENRCHDQTTTQEFHYVHLGRSGGCG